VVLTDNCVDGTKDSVVPLLLKLTVPGICVPPAESVITVLPTLAALSCALVTKSTRIFTGTADCPFAGLTVVIVGDVVSEPSPVVKNDSEDESGWPSMSVMPVLACTT